MISITTWMESDKESQARIYRRHIMRVSCLKRQMETYGSILSRMIENNDDQTAYFSEVCYNYGRVYRKAIEAMKLLRGMKSEMRKGN